MDINQFVKCKLANQLNHVPLSQNLINHAIHKVDS